MENMKRRECRESPVNHSTHVFSYPQILKNKLIFVETADIAETSVALDNFKLACDSGRGTSSSSRMSLIIRYIFLSYYFCFLRPIHDFVYFLAPSVIYSIH